MKYLASRLVIFPALGPLVGLLVLVMPFAVAHLLNSGAPASTVAGSGKISNTKVCLLITAAAYAVGVIPALAAAIADWHFADGTDHVLKTSLVGCVASAVLVSVLLRGRLDVMIALAAMAGAAAACACSLVHRSLHARRRDP